MSDRITDICNEKAKGARWFLLALLAYVLSSCAYLFLLLQNEYSSGTAPSVFSFIRRAAISRPAFIGAVILFALFAFFHAHGREAGEFLYRYRYLIAAAVFALCVAFGLSGSSIGMWVEYLGGEDTGDLLGAARAIRSDEWAVSTPMALSQYYNADGAFPYYGDTVRGTSTDMFLVYGQAVWDIGILFKPFYWGYLFLPASQGLAFFWCGRAIALFLVSFEMAMLITGKNRCLSAAGAFLITLAPAVQWWFAINGFVEMLISVQLSILLFRQYMTVPGSHRRALLAAGIFFCAGSFILTLYPAWQVPMAYVILALAIWVAVENHKGFRLTGKDVLTLILLAAVFLGIMGHILYNSRETIQAFLNTAYPGARSVTGGGEVLRIFNYCTNIWYALLGDGTYSNVCESAQFIDFFPLCYILPVCAMIKSRRKDGFSIALLSVSIFFSLWCFAGFPEALAKITLMNYSQANRTYMILGFVNVLLLLRGTVSAELKLKKIVGAAVAIVGSWAVVRAGLTIRSDYYVSSLMYVATILVFAVLFYLLMNLKKRRCMRVFSLLCSGIMVFSGALVNPVHQGVECIYGSETIQVVQEIHKSDEGALWAVEGLGLPYNNILIMAGAPTVNSTNVYPVLERWGMLDADGESEEIYNRYAHITIRLKEEGEAIFQLLSVDAFQVTMTADDLKALGVTYLFSDDSELERYSNRETTVQLLCQAGGYYIYEID